MYKKIHGVYIFQSPKRINHQKKIKTRGEMYFHLVITFIIWLITYVQFTKSSYLKHKYNQVVTPHIVSIFN